MPIGKRIKELRENFGLSREELGKRVGVSGAYISQIESGERTNISGKYLLKLKEIFNVTTDFLLTGDPNIKLPDVTNLDPKLQKVFYELIQDSNSQTEFRIDDDLGEEELESILGFILFTKNRAKQKRLEQGQGSEIETD